MIFSNGYFYRVAFASIFRAAHILIVPWSMICVSELREGEGKSALCTVSCRPCSEFRSDHNPCIPGLLRCPRQMGIAQVA